MNYLMTNQTRQMLYSANYFFIGMVIGVILTWFVLPSKEFYAHAVIFTINHFLPPLTIILICIAAQKWIDGGKK